MSDESNSERNVASRRTMLQSVAGATALSVVPTAVAADELTADERRQILQDKQDFAREFDLREAQRVFEHETRDLRSTLLRQGYLDRPSLAAFDGDADAARFATADRNFAAMPAYSKQVGEVTPHLYASTVVDGYEIELHVRAEQDLRIAIVTDTRTGNNTVVHPGDSDVSIDCDCSKDCNVACDWPGGAIVFQVCQSKACTDTTWDCTRDATCDECPDQSGCGGW